MSSQNTHLKHKRSLEDEINSWIVQIESKVSQLALNKVYIRDVLAAIRAAAAANKGYLPVKEIIKQHIQEAKHYYALFEELLQTIETLEVQRAQREQFSESWWQQQRTALHAQTDPAQGLKVWLQTYADALIASELGICDKLVQEPFPFLIANPALLKLFQTGTGALLAQQYHDALEMLSALVGGTPHAAGKSPLSPEQQAIIAIFVGRIYLYQANNPDAAGAHFELAQTRTPSSGQPFAALASYYQALGDFDQTVALAQQAIELSPNLPDGYVSLGIWAESQGYSDRADAFYDQAIEKVWTEDNPYLALSRLLAPLSGNLCLRLAQRLASAANHETALRVVDDAFARSLLTDSYKARGYELKGDLLKAIKRPLQETARAYHEAGTWCNWWAEYASAIVLFKQANELDPTFLPTYWAWAEALRMHSGDEGVTPAEGTALIAESLAVWNRGELRGLPSAGESWAYVTRGLINTRSEHLKPMVRAWEAITYIERAIRLEEADGIRWAALGSFHSDMKTEANALDATARAVRYLPDDNYVLDQRAVILANTGDFLEALKHIDKRLNQRDDLWARGVKTYILSRLDRFKEAIEQLPEDLADEFWLLNLRAFCHHRLGQQSFAKQDSQKVWQGHTEEDSLDQSEFAWAAYNLGLFDDAIKIYTTLIAESLPIDSFYRSFYRNRGLCYLTKGDQQAGESNLRAGEADLAEGIRRAVNQRELNDLLRFDFKDIEAASSSRPDSDQVSAILDRLRAQVQARRAELQQRPSAANELAAVVAAGEQEGQTDRWAWVGASAGLARLYAEEGRWSDAASIYQRLQASDDRFPEAHAGLEACVDGLQAEGERHLKDGALAEAQRCFTDALEITRQSLGVDVVRQAELRSRLGLTLFRQDDISGARTHFSTALELCRTNNLSDPAGALAASCRMLLQDVAQYWALDAEWQAFAHASTTDARLRADLANARKALATYLDDFYRLSAWHDKDLHALIVTPIMLEAEAGLVPKETGPAGPFITQVEEMRERVRADMGVTIPYVRGRRGAGASPDGYNIQLDEVPVARGRVPLGMCYCLSPAEALLPLDIPRKSLVEAPHPVTGEPGCWVPRTFRDQLAEGGFTFWEEPIIYCLYHVEAILRRNLANFLGVQEVESLLDTWRQNDRGPSLIRAALPDQDTRLRFVQLLRTLVREEVPITRWEDILEVVRDDGLTSAGRDELVRAIRLRLRSQLPGNRLSAQRIEIPPEWEEAMLGHADDRMRLTVAPHATATFLSIVRSWLRSAAQDAVLVTRSPELRPFVRRLVEGEFPSLMVLSKEELLTPEELARNARSEDTPKGVYADAPEPSRQQPA